jgi:neutral ceramidase
MKLCAGSAKVNITPPLSIPYLGYVPRQGKFRAIHDPLFARALVLDNSKTRLAIISADSLGYGNEILGTGRNLTAEVRQRIKARVGIEPHSVMLASTHAHSTPETLGITRLFDVPEAIPWLEVLMDQLASVVEMASANLMPARLKLGTGQVREISHNRRVRNLSVEEQIAQGLVDPEVGILLCEGLESNESFIVVNFACHPVTVQVQPLVSADYPGVATDIVERTVHGCQNCLFLQGAAGNINPIRDDTRDFADVKRYGMSLAGEVLKVVGSLQAPETPVMEPNLAAISEVLRLPVRDLPDPEPIKEAYEQAMKALESARTDQERYRALQTAREYRESLDFIEHGTDPIPAEVQVLRIGELALASTPGEMFVQLGLEIKRRSAAPHTFVVELANGWIGYLLNPGGFEEGGYEALPGPWTKVSEDAGQMLVDKAAELTGSLWRQ